MTTYIAVKKFKYNEKVYQPGDEIVPANGLWDHVIFDPEKKYVGIQKGKPAPEKKKDDQEYKCEYCERVFGTSQARAAHTRFCKEKEQ